MRKIILLSTVTVLIYSLMAFGSINESRTSNSLLRTDGPESKINNVLGPKNGDEPIAIQQRKLTARSSQNITGPEKVAVKDPLSLKRVDGRNSTWSASPNVTNAIQSNSTRDLPRIQTTYFEEGFENGGSIPPGWADVPGGLYPWLFNDGSGAGMPGSTHSGNYLAYFFVFSFPPGINDSLISPPITLTGDGNYQLVFWSWDDVDPRGVMDSVYVKIKFGNGAFNYLTTVPYDSAGWIQNIIPFHTTATTIRIEFVGHSELGFTCPCIDDIAVMDVASEGRCCYGDPHNPECAVNTQSDCDGLGGSWVLGEDCESSPCPVAPANDECAAAQPISGPYPQTIYGSTEGATVDCPGLFDWNGVWYTIDLPFGLNDVSIDFSPTCALGGMDWVGVAYMADCSCLNPLVFESGWEFCQDGSYYATLDGIIPGPTTIYFPCWAADASRNGIDFGFTIGVRELSVPLNDNCADAEPIGYVDNLPFCTIAASFDGPRACQSASNIWYLFTAPETGPVEISLCGSLFDTKMALYDGPDCPAGIPEPVPLQGGDTFDDAVDIGTTNIAYSGTTTDFNHDIYLSCDNSNTAPDVVYSYSPTSDGIINVALCGSLFDTILGIFMDNENSEIGCNDDYCGMQSGVDGISVVAGHTYYFVITGFSGSFGDYVISVMSPDYTLLDCNDDFCGSQSQIAIQAEQGHQYLIEIGASYSGFSGDGILTIAPPAPPPSNDNCANADDGGLLLPGVPIQFTGTTVGATPDCNLGFPEVWVSFTLEECQNVTIDECGTNPVFSDAFIVVEQSCCGDNIYADYWDTTSCDGNWRIHFSNLQPGQYWYPVLKTAGSNGPYVLNVNGEACPPPPENDNCDSAVPLVLVPGAPLTFTGNNTGATSDCPLLGTPDVWHAFMIDQNMKVTIDFCGSDPVHDEYFWIIARDCPCSDYALRDYSDTTTCEDGMITMVYNMLLPGTYYIPILSTFDQWGPYTVHVSAEAPPSPSENACDGSGLIYTNGPDNGSVAIVSQCEPAYPSAAEVADDLVLPGSGNIEISEVVSYCGFWHGSGQSPDLFTGINLVIYIDDNGVPGGQPAENDPACVHQENIPGGIVAGYEFAPGEFTFGQMGSGAWQIEMPLNPPLTLAAGATYWLGFQPVMDSLTGGRCGAFATSGATGSRAVQGFPSQGIPFWTSSNYDVAFCLLGAGCDYAIGDVNGSGTFNGLDVVYSVSYFKGGPQPPYSCECTPGNTWFVAGDVNNSCNFNGLDVSYMVSYFKGGPSPNPCNDCPPPGLLIAPPDPIPAVEPINTSKPSRRGIIESTN